MSPLSLIPIRNRVSAESRKWEARLGHTSEDAARAYDIVSIKLKGRDAITNFDWNSYEVSGIMDSVITQAADGSVILQKQGNNNNEIEARPRSSNNPQQVIRNSSYARASQNPNLTSSNPYTLGGFSGGAGSSSNSIANHAGEFPNQTATLQQSLQTQNQVNVNNDFNQNLLNNSQFLPRSSNLPLLAHTTQNLELGKCLRFPDWPSDFGTRLLGGNLDLEPLRNIPALNVQSQRHECGIFKQYSCTEYGISNAWHGAINGGCSFGSEIHQVAPLNQEFGATQLQLPELNQSYEPYNYSANTLNQNPLENLNSNFSDGFQNPNSEPNNTIDPQSQTAASQIDVDVSHYLNRSYLEDNDFACDYDMFEVINGGRQGI
ncbi:hypothetical protein CR513_62830, partial [Mucuna pruriens]